MSFLSEDISSLFLSSSSSRRRFCIGHQSIDTAAAAAAPDGSGCAWDDASSLRVLARNKNFLHVKRNERKREEKTTKSQFFPSPSFLFLNDFSLVFNGFFFFFFDWHHFCLFCSCRPGRQLSQAFWSARRNQ